MSLHDKIKNGALVLDVRSVDEYEDDHYPDALNIPLDQLQGRMTELGDKDRAIVVYCLSGARSAYAARILKASGFADVVNAGGIDDMPGR